jgi:fused signal recognition particle receptor
MSEKPEQKKGWFQRLTSGLARSSQAMTEQVTGTFTKKPLDQEQLDAAGRDADRGRPGPADRRPHRRRLRQGALRQVVDRDARSRKPWPSWSPPSWPTVRAVFDPLSGDRPYVVLFIGVNGSGKTTTLGKIAADLTEKGAKVLIAAGDTFRAAAVEQLKVWADRAGADFMSKPTAPTPPPWPMRPSSAPRPSTTTSC